MKLPKYVEESMKHDKNQIDRLQRMVGRLTAENAQLKRELELATESWTDEERDNNKRKAEEGN